MFDYSYLRHLPGMTVMAPKNEAELRDMLKTALALGGPVAVRYPRGAAVGVKIPEAMTMLPLGKAEVLRNKGSIALLAIGSMVQATEKAADLLAEEGIAVRVVNMRFVKPLDTELLLSLARDPEIRGLVTLEENMLAGGFGSAVLEALSDAGVQMPVRRFGIGDTFVEQGTREELLELCGLTAPQIAEGVKTFLRSIAQDQKKESV